MRTPPGDLYQRGGELYPSFGKDVTIPPLVSRNKADLMKKAPGTSSVSGNAGLFLTGYAGTINVDIDRSSLSGGNYSVSRFAPSGVNATFNIGNSKLSGPVSAPEAVFNCAGVYNQAYTVLSSA